MFSWLQSVFRPAAAPKPCDVEAAHHPKVLNLNSKATASKPTPSHAASTHTKHVTRLFFGVFAANSLLAWWSWIQSFFSRLALGFGSMRGRLIASRATDDYSGTEMDKLPVHAPRATPAATRPPTSLVVTCSTPPLPTPPVTPRPTGPHYTIGDFVAYMPYKLAVNAYYQPVADLSEKWLDDHGVHPSARKKAGFEACNFGLLTAMCYPDSDYDRFRVLCDYINCLFAFDDLTDEGGLRQDGTGTKKASDIIMNALHHPFDYKTEFRCGQVFSSFWGRALEVGCAPGTQRRFLEYTDLYVQAVHEQVLNRANGHIPDLESWITLRRDTGALKMCFAMGEFAQDIDLPDEVFECPLIRIMEDCANDIVVLTNDIYSFNIEQAQGDTCNIIEVVMKEKKLDIQAAMDYAGELVKGRVDLYLSSKAQLPSWGPQVDADVLKYCRIMEAWDVGGCVWSLESKRYFGEKVDQVRKTLCVELLPKEIPRGQMAIPDLDRA